MGKYCDNCGCELKKEARFCPNCGQKIVDVGKNAEVQEINEWQEIYQKTYRKAYAVAFQIMKNKEDAQDVLQEAYISAFKNMNSLKDKEKVGAWINQIVANRCKDWLRKKNPALFSDMGSEDNDTDYEESLLNENQEFMPEESIDYEDTKKIMQDILSALPEEQRLCILMYYYEELSVGEIAEALECSTGTVKSRLNYARKFIKIKVEELEKQGTKLYGIAPIPFIVWMLSLKENAVEVEAAEQSCWGKIENKYKKSTLEDRIGIDDSNGAATNQQQDRELSSNSSKLDDKKKNVINKTGKAVVKSGAKHIVTKVIAGTVVAAVALGGGYQIARNQNDGNNSSKKTNKSHTALIKNLKPANKEDKKKKQLEALEKKIDYDYLVKMCTYLPANVAMNEIAEDELTNIYSEAVAFYFEDHYCEKYHGSSEYVDTYGEKRHGTTDFYSFKDREIISDDQEVSEEDRTLTFKSTVFDQFNEIAGITTDPKSLNLGYVEYNGENYVANMGDDLDNITECVILDKGFDYDNNKIIVRLEKKELNSDEESGETKVYESVEISPSDNAYGYQIDYISGSKEKLEKSEDVIAADLKNNSDKLLSMAKVLGNYHAKEADKEKIMVKIADGVVFNWSNDSEVEYTTKNYFIDACELIGISDQKAEDGYTEEIADLAGENLQEYRSATNTAIGTFFLRTEADEKKEGMNVYYLSSTADGNGGFYDFQKGVIHIQPSYNAFGYKIIDVSLEEWNDGYSADLTDIEEEAYRKADYGDSAIARDITNAVNQSVEYWEEQADNMFERVESKYPEEKEALEKNQKKYQENIEKQIEKAKEEDERSGMMGNSLMSPGRVAPSFIKLNAAQERVYYLVGNFLMDNKTEVLNEK